MRAGHRTLTEIPQLIAHSALHATVNVVDEAPLR